MSGQSTPFKTKYLPLGYEEGDFEAISSMIGFLQNLVKHERTLICNLLLTNIKREPGRERVGAVPKLSDPYLILDNKSQNPYSLIMNANSSSLLPLPTRRYKLTVGPDQ
ncbi:hypothetical protein VP01_3167g3 [Puccinia sorghi]|uniref:Uncharacterized protein n=1 Tax=Puccinia sorghi TaxID=27349 RepID=A0A0L6UYP1_9BASI|nr:hypothetical protein VP01_3167g3 [Puccinia sorghi]